MDETWDHLGGGNGRKEGNGNHLVKKFTKKNLKNKKKERNPSYLEPDGASKMAEQVKV